MDHSAGVGVLPTAEATVARGLRSRACDHDAAPASLSARQAGAQTAREVQDSTRTGLDLRWRTRARSDGPQERARSRRVEKRAATARRLDRSAERHRAVPHRVPRADRLVFGVRSTPGSAVFRGTEDHGATSVGCSSSGSCSPIRFTIAASSRSTPAWRTARCRRFTGRARTSPGRDPSRWM